MTDNRGKSWTAEEILGFREQAKQFGDDYDAGSYACNVIRWLATIDQAVELSPRFLQAVELLRRASGSYNGHAWWGIIEEDDLEDIEIFLRELEVNNAKDR